MSALEQAARDLLMALDRGYLAYKADHPESAFVAALRRALDELDDARRQEACVQLMQAAE